MIQISMFTDEHASRLAAFLNAPERPEGSMSYCEAAGFLFAVASAPDIVQPSEWIPVVFNEKEAGFATLAEAQEILPLMMALYNHTNNGVLTEAPALPPLCTIHADVMANFSPDAPLSRWARGFGAGYDWLVDAWDTNVKEVSDDIGPELLVLSFFASRDLAEAYRKELDAVDKSLADVATEMLTAIPEAMRSYARIGRSLYKANLAERQRKAHTPARSEKIARNDPCPCGSGKKYKKCCGAVH